MSARREGALALVDDASDVVGRLGPWVGLLWITAIPARLLLALFCLRLVELGAGAAGYGLLLTRLAYLALGAWLVSLWGRLVFVRACRHALESARPLGLSGLRLPPAELASYLFAALAIEVLFWALFLTGAAPVALLVAAGLAAAAAPRAPVSLWQPLREVGASAGSLLVLLRLLLVFALAVVLAAANLHVLAHAGLWLAGGVAGQDTAAWKPVLSFSNPLYKILIAAGATLLLEPFWLAALSSHVERVRSRKSGDDLRQWFARVRTQT